MSQVSVLVFAAAFLACACQGDARSATSARNAAGPASQPAPAVPRAAATQRGARPFPFAAALSLVSTGKGPFRPGRIEVMESYPVQFALHLRRTVPTAGWRFMLGAIRKHGPEAQRPGRVTVPFRLVPPGGPAAQVLAELDCRIPLGSLRRGRWRLELESGEGRVVQTLELVAR